MPGLLFCSGVRRSIAASSDLAKMRAKEASQQLGISAYIRGWK